MTNDQKLDVIVDTVLLMNDKISNMDKRLEVIEGRLDVMDKRFEVIEGRLDAMDKRFEVIEGRLDAMENDIKVIKNDVFEIKLQVENEIIRDIQRVAEGHVDLDRKLNEARTSNQEYETLTLRVNHLEVQVEKLMKKIS